MLGEAPDVQVAAAKQLGRQVKRVPRSRAYLYNSPMRRHDLKRGARDRPAQIIENDINRHWSHRSK